MLTKKTVQFLEDGSSDAELFIALSCVDADTHLQMLQEIVEFCQMMQNKMPYLMPKQKKIFLQYLTKL